MLLTSAKQPANLQKLRFGAQSAFDAPAVANLRGQYTSAAVEPVHAVEPITRMGELVADGALVAPVQGRGSLEGPLNIPDLVWLAASCLGSVAATTPAGATLTRRWTFKPSYDGGAIPVGLTLEKGSGSLWDRLANALVAGMSISVADGQRPNLSASLVAGSFQGSVLGLGASRWVIPLGDVTGTYTISLKKTAGGNWETTSALAHSANAAAVLSAIDGLASFASADFDVVVSPGVSVTLTAKAGGSLATADLYAAYGTWVETGYTLQGRKARSYGAEAQVTKALVGPKQTKLYLADSVANLAGGVVRRSGGYGLVCDWGVENRWEVGDPLYDEANELIYREMGLAVQATLTVERASGSEDLRGALASNAMRYLRMVFDTRRPIEGAFTHKATLTMPMQVVDHQPAEANGHQAERFTLGLRRDESFGGAFEVVIDTTVESVETGAGGTGGAPTFKPNWTFVEQP